MLAVLLGQIVPAYASAPGPTIVGVANPVVSLAPGSSFDGTNHPRVWSADRTSHLQVSNGTWTTVNGTPSYAYRWLRCATKQVAAATDLPSGCVEVPGEVANTYIVGADDAGYYVVGAVDATDTAGTSSVYSASTERVNSAPSTDSAATLTSNGDLVSGNTISVAALDWVAIPAATVTYQWYGCAAAVSSASSVLAAGCSAIAAATSSTLMLTNANKGKYLLAGVFAKNDATGVSSVARYSASTQGPLVGAPALKATVLGSNATLKFTKATTATLNSKLTVDLTGWSTATAFTYKWFRCVDPVLASESSPLDCTEINGATASSYTVTANDVGKYVTGFVTGKTGTQTIAAARIATAQQVLQAPVNTSPATILSSVISIGRTLTAVNGSWSASPTVSYAYQWYSCSVAVAAAAVKNAKCAAISGATQQNYTITANQSNKFLVVQVLATNDANVGAPISSFSASSTKVLTDPSNTAPPRVTSSLTATTGQPVVGGVLTVTPGTWTGNPAPKKTYQWYSCVSPVLVGSTSLSTDDCQAIGGAVGNSYTITLDQQGSYITVGETGTNDANASTVYAAAGLTAQTKPIFSSDPTLSGAATTGGTLSVTSGASNTGGTPSETYSWAKCSSVQVAGASFGTGCSVIAGEVSSSLTVTTTLEGSYVVSKVTLANAAGNTTRTSASSVQVTGGLNNVSLGQPVSTKTYVQLGTVVNATSGTWTGFPLPVFTYQWYRCDDVQSDKADSVPSGCGAISGATGNSYTPVLLDSGKYLSIMVTATQGLNTSSVWSPTSLQVLELPSFTGVQTVGAQHTVGGDRLVPVVGSVRGVSAPTPSFTWYRCTTQVLADSAAIPIGCSIISGITTATYEFVAADVGKYITSGITITNELGSAKRYSASSAVVNVAPANLTSLAPTTAVAPVQVGNAVTAGATTWSAYPNPTLTYQWYRCDFPNLVKSALAPDRCYSIGGATDPNYVPTTADSSKYLLAAVKATNDYGFDVVFSPTTADVAEMPSIVRGPTISSNREKGQFIGVTPTQVQGWPTPTFNYRWLRCDAPVDAISSTMPNCPIISGGVTDTYLIAAADVQKYLVVETKAVNKLGSVTRYSASSQQVRQIPEIAATARISGNQWVDQTLTATGISVVGFPTPLVSIQWYRCILSGCTAVGVTGSSTYQLVADDRAAVIKYVVTARNEAGVSVASSNNSDPIRMAPKLLADSFPTVTGQDLDGEASSGATLTANPGLWDGTPTPDLSTGYKYQWYSCTLIHPLSTSTIPADCTSIASQTTSQYLVKFTDALHFIGFSIIVSNGTQDTTWFSSTTAKVYVAPAYKTGAKTAFGANQAASDGSPRVGYQIEASEGNWNGTPVPSYTYQWFACTSALAATAKALPDTCTEIPLATSRVFTITSDQVNKYLGVYIEGHYKGYYDFVDSITTTKPVVSPPVNLTAPKITNRFTYVNSTLKTTDGTWAGTPTPTQTHTWWECSNSVDSPTSVQPNGCTELANSSGTWKILPAQLGKYLVSAVTSQNTAGATKIWSASTDVIRNGAVNIVPPTVTFTGGTYPSTLTQLKISDAKAGDWVGTPDPYLDQYAWYRCKDKIAAANDYIDSNCDLVTGSLQTYTPTPGDVGFYMVAAVRYTNGENASVVFTVSTDVINQPPSNRTPPVMPLAAFVDKDLVSDTGAWDGFPAPTYAKQWLLCNTKQDLSATVQPAGCSEITGATNTTYKPLETQLGKFLVLRITASNLVGSATVWSSSTNAVVSGPVKKVDPVFTYPPTATTPATTLNPVVGQALTTDGGVWRGLPTPAKSYEWFVCPAALKASDTAPAADANCVKVDGATLPSYTPTEDQRGKFLLVHVHAVNEHGEADTYSATTTVVWMAPVPDQPVVAWGTAFNRLYLKGKLDTWKAFPELTAANRTYEWYVCDSPSLNPGSTLPASCETTKKGSAYKYKLPDAPTDDNRYMLVKIKGSNAAGAFEYYSATSDQIKNGPVNERSPTLTGASMFQAGTTTVLTGTAGTWSPTDVMLTYQWYRCGVVSAADDELDSSCVAIRDAIGTNYTLTEFDPGNAIVFGVTGEKNNLRSTSYSASTALITEKVRNVTAPSITGVPKVDTDSTGVDGDWRGFPVITKKRSWYSCTTKPLQAGVTKPASCTLLSGAVGNTLTNDTDLIGKSLVYSITATNTIGTTKYTLTLFSAGTEPVIDSPRLVGKPALVPPAGFAGDDQPNVGTSWGVSATWSNSVKPTETYQWYRCDSLVDTQNTAIAAKPSNCVEIGGATSGTYTITLDDRGKYLLVGLTGTNQADTVTQFTNSTADPVAQAPIADPLPTVSGSRNIGSVLTADPGVWTPSDTVISYRWYSCDAPLPTTVAVIPAGCTMLDGTTANYTIGEFDAGKYITVQVSGQKGKSTSSYMVSVTSGANKAPVIGDTVPKILSDALLVGTMVSVYDDKWDAMPAITADNKTYQWYDCDAAVSRAAATLAAGCTAISGATAVNYQVQASDLGKYLLAAVTATNAVGSATYYSASTDGPMDAGYEVDTAKVSVAVDQNKITATTPVTISMTPGTWKKAGTPAVNVVLVHRWVYCRNAITTEQVRFPAGCDFMFPTRTVGGVSGVVAAEDTTALTLDWTSEFAGYYIASVEYVFNPLSPANTDQKTRRQAIKISKTSPRILIAPRLWTEHPNYKEPSVTNTPMVGGSASVIESTLWQPDTDTISDQLLTSATWRGVEAGTLTYRWFTCSTRGQFAASSLPANCAFISGATDSTYTPVASDRGRYLGVAIKATNSAGDFETFTKTSDKINMAPVLDSNNPNSVSSVSFTGDRATITPGTWIAEPAVAATDYTYRWFLCDVSVTGQILSSAAPSGCTVVTNTYGVALTGQSITIPSLGVSNATKRLVGQVTVKNYPYIAAPATQAVTRASDYTVQLQERPYYTTDAPLPVTTGGNTATAANVGETVSILDVNSKWVASPVGVGGFSYSYQWYDCGDQLPYTSTVMVRAASIDACTTELSGQTSRSLTLTHDLVGHYVIARVKAQTGDWVGYAWTDSTEKIFEKPFLITAPSIAGVTPNVGTAITATAADFGGTPLPTVDTSAFEWYSCTSSVAASTNKDASCTRISTLTPSLSYTPTRSDRGKYLMFSSTSYNQVNPHRGTTVTAKYYSATSAQVLMAPEFWDSVRNVDGSPSFSSLPHVGVTQTLNIPSVTGYPVPAGSDLTWDWYACTSQNTSATLSSIPAGCSKVSTDANQTTFAVTDSIVGKYLDVFATATNSVGTTKKNTTTAKPVTMSPVNAVEPTVSGTAVANGTNVITGTAGRWNAYPAIPSNGSNYSWYVCSAASSVSSTRPGTCPAGALVNSTGTPGTLLLTRDMAGKYIVLQETANQAWNNTNLNKSGSIFSASTSVITAAPKFEVNPTVSGTRHIGETLTVSNGTISGYPSSTPTYQWISCSNQVTSNAALPTGCSDIAGQISSSYQITTAVADRFVTVKVTATNDVGSQISYALSSTQKITQSPTLVSSLTISGDTVVGTTKAIVASPGSWIAYPTLDSKVFNWFYCDTPRASASSTLDATDCAKVTGATGAAVATSSLPLTANLRGKYILAEEIATNSPAKVGAGVATQYTATMGPINMAPVFNSNPVISGIMHVGETVSVSTPPVSAYPLNDSSYDWYSCSAPVANSVSAVPVGCTLLSGLGNANLTLTDDLAGDYVIAVFSNSNISGGAQRSSTQTYMVTKSLTNSTQPVVSGDPLVGASTPVSVSTGDWTSVPTPQASDFSYSWYQCPTATPSNISTDCDVIAGQTAATISPTNAMAGKYLVAKVSVSVNTNKAGTGTGFRFSTMAGPVRNLPQFGSNVPTVSGVAHVGETLTETQASVSGFDTPRSTYQWWQCSAGVTAGTADVSGSCTQITDAGNAALVITSAMAGKRIVAVQTASNAQGAVSRSSGSTAAVTAAPTITSAPVVSGADIYTSGATVSVTTGTWSGFPVPTGSAFTYAWYKCSTRTDAGATLTGCASISGASASTLALTSGMWGSYLVAKVSATTVTNKTGSNSGFTYSAGFGPIRIAPYVATAPSFSPTTIKAGQTVTANVGAWTGTGPITTTYKWYSCPATITVAASASAVPATCTAIAGFDNQPLVVPAAFATKKILLSVTAANFASTLATSTTSGAVTAASVEALFWRSLL